ncbi:MAG: CrcB family protein [Duncaniella sp.]|nr:CrcB family protein [Duncaniella sp.]
MILSFGQCVAVAAGGAVGCLCRYAAQVSCLASVGKAVPTLAVNIAGCLLIGIVSVFVDHLNPAPWVRLLCVTGFLGGFTTYSTFALDSVNIAQTDSLLHAAIYVFVTVIGGVAACLTGRYAAVKVLELLG